MDRKASFKGYFAVETLTIWHQLFEGGRSRPVRREFFQRGDVLGVLPWNPVSAEVVLIEQFRVGKMRDEDSLWMLGLIARIAEPGESDTRLAQRKAQQEAACQVGRLEPIASFYPCAGACPEQIRLFVGEATVTRPGTVQGLDGEHEDIFVHQMPRGSVLAMLDHIEINN